MSHIKHSKQWMPFLTLLIKLIYLVKTMDEPVRRVHSGPRRGPRYRWRRGGREMDGKCRTEPPALPLSEVHQEGSYLAWCRKFHDSIKFNMLQEHNLLPQNHSKKNWKKSAKEDRFILQKMFVQEIFQWIWKLLLPHSIINYILFEVAVWGITSFL